MSPDARFIQNTPEPRAEAHSHPLDLSEPRSPINLSNATMQEKIKAAAAAEPELFELDEANLYDALKKSKRTPTATDNRIRLAFWNEYNRCLASGRHEMDPFYIFSGICVRNYFYNQYLMQPHRVAWMMCMPVSYEVSAREALSYGMERMRQYLSIDPTYVDAKGNVGVNTRLMELQAKIVTMLDNRIHGAATQRIEQKSLSINVSDKKIGMELEGKTIAELDHSIKQIEAKLSKNVTEQVVEVEDKVIEVEGSGSDE